MKDVLAARVLEAIQAPVQILQLNGDAVLVDGHIELMLLPKQ